VQNDKKVTYGLVGIFVFLVLNVFLITIAGKEEPNGNKGLDHPNYAADARNQCGNQAVHTYTRRRGRRIIFNFPQ